jgi:hypothetical protein
MAWKHNGIRGTGVGKLGPAGTRRWVAALLEDSGLPIPIPASAAVRPEAKECRVVPPRAPGVLLLSINSVPRDEKVVQLLCRK